MVELEIALDRMKVTHFSPLGELEYVAASDHPRDMVRTLKALLEEHSEIEWRIRPSGEAPAPIESLADRRKREEARALEELKRQPFVAEALKHFPGAVIADVREPPAEGGGDVVPMPQQKAPAPHPARKKEV
jgi:DNA polymerase-3 subunit gamma/tau